MPLYTYKCDACENMYEKRQRFNDPYDSACPVCGEPVRRVINQVGIVFKGSGFYVTDSRGKNSAAVPPGGSAAASGETTKSADDAGSAAPATTGDSAAAQPATPSPAATSKQTAAAPAD